MTDSAYQDQLITSARALVSALEAGDEQTAESHLILLTQGRENHLLLEVGKLTRELHETISNFDVNSRIANLAETDLPDSQARLDYVINTTQEAAHKTLEAIDNALPHTEQLHHITQSWQDQFASTSNIASTQQTHQELNQYFNAVRMHTSALQGNLSDITTTQGFQDLTGQVIQKVTQLISEVEAHLLKLVSIASKYQPQQHKSQTKAEIDPLKAEGPQIKANPHTTTVNNQGDVDDILSNLGF